MNKKEFETKVHKLYEDGYIPFVPNVSDVESATSGAYPSSSFMSVDVNNDISNGLSYSYITIGKGDNASSVVSWGAANDLPMQIIKKTDSLPYTAQAIRYLIDITYGLGPRMMYSSSTYSNGSTKEILIPYESAGEFLRGRMREAKAVGDADTVADLQTRLDIWKSTNAEYQEFITNNNIDDIALHLITDYTYLDICFPTVGLSTERRIKDEITGKYQPWNPKIVRIGYIPAVCSRYEEMDDNLRINNVFYSELWRQSSSFNAAINDRDYVKYPTLMQHNFITKLRKMIKDQANVARSARTSWYCSPVSLPSSLYPYYPVPAWWSVFTCYAYQAASTLIIDKATARKNATMWGKMVFINNEYLRAIFAERNADTQEEREAVRTEIWSKINSFLRRKENNGKTIALDSFMSPDGKTLFKAIEVVDVPQMTASGNLTEELAELTSIIFFALGVHPGLIGAIPGQTKSNSGTYQRELTLLKQNQNSPRQRQILKFLQNINTFNGWDPAAKWVFKQQVLTTLDRNPQGVEEQSTI